MSSPSGQGAGRGRPETPERASRTDLLDVEAATEDDGERLDRLLASRLAGLSRSRLTGLIRDGRVSGPGGTIEDPSRRVKPGERFTVAVPPPAPAEPKAEPIPLTIVYEDEHLVVVDKPAGLVVHPSPGHEGGTLVNALISHCGESLSGIGGVRRPGIVHRLDKDTSGLMVVAKTDAAHADLAAQFADHGRTGALERAYVAFVWGVPPRTAGSIDRPIGRHKTDRLRQAIRDDDGGRRSVTHYTVARRFFRHPDKGRSEQPVVSEVRCRLETGRTHQVRVHLASIGCPLLGDDLYGAGFRSKATQLPEDARKALAALNRQALHAVLLAFAHPADGRVLRFESPLPPELSRLEASLSFL